MIKGITQGARTGLVILNAIQKAERLALIKERVVKLGLKPAEANRIETCVGDPTEVSRRGAESTEERS